jgi:carbon monoxide dehydrogenase subunit G
VELAYISGLFLGRGEWLLEPLGRDQTRLTYQADAEIAGFAARLLARTVDLRALHSQWMHSAFNGLAALLRGPDGLPPHSAPAPRATPSH